MNSPEEKTIKRKSPMRPKSRRFIFVKTLLLIISYVLVALIVWQIQSRLLMREEKNQNPSELEVRALVEKLSAIMLVPQDELPQMITIEDAANLSKTQSFLANIKDGDKVFIYQSDKRAIIYRPSENKIVNAGPILANELQAPQVQNSTNSATTTPQNKPKQASE